MVKNTSQRFNRLLKAMASGVSASKTLSKGSATSGAGPSAGSNDIQIRQDKSVDISGTHEHKSRDKKL